jgi:N6-adenosine-specific RNA methylase IME4
MTLEKAKAQRSEVAAGTVSDARPAMGATNGIAVRKYKIIYADPPWSYDNNLKERIDMGGTTYPRMNLEDIKAVPVPDLADEECILFLWGTWPKLQETLEVIKAWGFKYITVAFLWVKTYPKKGTIVSGIGHWTKGNTEFCLLAKKGKCTRWRKAMDVMQVIMAPKDIHSRKPPEARDRIVRLLGDLPRIELFARQRVDGWDAWGNEVDSTVQLESQPESRRGCSGGAKNDPGTTLASQVPAVPYGPSACIGPGNFTGYTGPSNSAGYTGYTGPQPCCSDLPPSS